MPETLTQQIEAGEAVAGELATLVPGAPAVMAEVQAATATAASIVQTIEAMPPSATIVDAMAEAAAHISEAELAQIRNDIADLQRFAAKAAPFLGRAETFLKTFWSNHF